MNISGSSNPRPERGLGHVLFLNQSWEERAFIEARLNAEGFATTGGGSPVDLTVEFARFDPDVVIIGTAPTDNDPRTLCAFIRARSGVPVIALVDKGTVDAVELLDLGADVAMMQPVSAIELLARMRALLRRTPARSFDGDEMLAFDDLKLDRPSRVLSTAAGAIDLEGRELALMETLMQNGERVTSRHRLQAVLAVEAPDLDAHVRRLRQRLETVEGWRRIVSAHGLGFRLLEQQHRDSDP